jgi:glycosyltransferase involved in cell wall biosynthesis
VFNGEEFLGDAIESVLSQTLTDFELIIVDDASTDQSVAIIEKYAAVDSRIRWWLNRECLGLLNTHNLCLERATAAVVKPFAQTDLLYPRMLQRAHAVLNEHREVSLVSTRRRWINDQGADITGKSRVSSASDFCDPEVVVPSDQIIVSALFRLDNFIGEPCAVAFRRGSMQAGFDTRFKQIADLELWMRILSTGDYYFINETLCDYRPRPDDYSGDEKLLRHAVDFLRLGRMHKEFLADRQLSEQDFLENATALIARHVFWLVEHNELSLGEMRENNALTAGCAQDSDFELLKEMSLRSLCEMERLTRKYERGTIEQVSTHGQIKFLERRLRDLLRSPSWRSTAWLRHLNLVISPHTAQKVNRVLSSPDNRAKLTTAHGYSYYLRRNIALIRRSMSWKLTRPLRVLERQIADQFKGPEKESNPELPAAAEELSSGKRAVQYEVEVALTAILRGSAADIRKWISFHQERGVQRFYLFCGNDLHFWQTSLSDWVEEGLVRLYSILDEEIDDSYAIPTKRIARAGRQALALAKDQAKWLAFIECDEFLTPIATTDLPSFLAEYARFGAVCVNYNQTQSYLRSSHTLSVSGEAPTNESWMALANNHRIRAIVRPERVLKCLDHQVFSYRSGFFQVNEDKIVFSGPVSPYIADRRIVVTPIGSYVAMGG